MYTLQQFKKANKERKLYMAKKAGFETIESYELLLKLNNNINKLTSVPDWLKPDAKPYLSPKPIETIKPTIHNVVILDGSGSMDGSKFENSVKGIITELNHMILDRTVDWTSTIFKFSGEDYSQPHFMTRNLITPFEVGYPEDGTPLYKSIIRVLTNVKEKVNPNEKVLVKIYTDGQDTRGRMEECKALLKSLDKSMFTITFVGTEVDVTKIIKVLDLEKSNTLVIDNTGEGFEKAFKDSLTATKTYTEKVVKGEDVSKGFYLEFN